jgi:type VI secretion system protein ImpK
MEALLNQAEAEALQAGYSPQDAGSGKFAVTAFLDDAVLSSRNPILAGWVPMLGGNAGEVFFQNLKSLLGNTPETADLLELYLLCLLLGYRGEYRVKGGDPLVEFSTSVTKKIGDIRGTQAKKSPPWEIPGNDNLPQVRSPWFKRILIATICSMLLFGVVFAVACNQVDSTLKNVRTHSANQVSP